MTSLKLSIEVKYDYPRNWPDWHMDQLGQITAEMTRLRSLELGSSRKAFDLDSVITGLTGLTSLRCKGKFAADVDLGVCGALPRLRILSLVTHRK